MYPQSPDIPGRREKFEKLAMRSPPRLSIGRLMGFIALFAVELALLQHLRWDVLIFPPVTLGITSLNLAILKGLRWLPRSMAGRINGMLCGGMIALFVLVGYHVLTVSPGRGGFIGQAISQFLANRSARGQTLPTPHRPSSGWPRARLGPPRLSCSICSVWRPSGPAVGSPHTSTT